MSIHASIFRGEHGRTIYVDDRAQELIGPASAQIRVEDEPDLCPYPIVALTVELREGRYDVTELQVNADHGPPIAVRGLQTIRIPEIVRRGLRDEVTIRRTTEYGATTTGVSRDDEVPLVYLLARAVGDDPTKAVQEEFKMTTRQAAAQRVARARKAGRIPPTTRGAR